MKDKTRLEELRKRVLLAVIREGNRKQIQRVMKLVYPEKLAA